MDDSFTIQAFVGDLDYDPSCGITSVWLGNGVIGLTANNTLLIGYATRDGIAHVARLSNDGSVDSTFPERTAPVTFDLTGAYATCGSPPMMIYRRNYLAIDFPFKKVKAVAGDKMLLVGSFADYGGTPAHGIVRLNFDGSIDPTFNVGAGAQWTQTQETQTFHPGVDNLEFLPNGKLLLTGTFEAFNGTLAPGIVCLNADGSVDTSFVAPVARQKYDHQPTYLKVQPDGSVLLSGPYSRVGQTNSPSFFRLVLAPTATSAVSRKNHGAAGAFDVNLPLTGTPGVEDRSGGGTNDFTIVVSFASNVTVTGNPQAQVTSGTGTVGTGGVSNGGMVAVSGNIVTIPLTDVADRQTINITLNGVNNASAGDAVTANVVIPMSRLLGDTNGNRAVNASDVSQTKTRIGQSVTSTNFRSDINASGTINAGDVSLIKSNTGHALP